MAWNGCKHDANIEDVPWHITRGNEEWQKRCRVLQQLPCPQLLLLTSALPQSAPIIFAFYIYPLSPSALWDRCGILASVLSDEIPAVHIWGWHPNGARSAWNGPPANEHTQPCLPSVPSSRGVREMIIVILYNEHLVFNNDSQYSLWHNSVSKNQNLYSLI